MSNSVAERGLRTYPVSAARTLREEVLAPVLSVLDQVGLKEIRNLPVAVARMSHSHTARWASPPSSLPVGHMAAVSTSVPHGVMRNDPRQGGKPLQSSGVL